MGRITKSPYYAASLINSLSVKQNIKIRIDLLVTRKESKERQANVFGLFTAYMFQSLVKQQLNSLK